MNTAAEEILSEAARLLEVPGTWWQKGRMGVPSGLPLCLWLACATQRDTYPRLLSGPDSPVRLALLKEIGSTERSSPIPLYAWNDTPGRKVEEVVATLRNAKRWL